MARTKGTFSLSANIEPRAAAPLDAREKVALISDLTAIGTFPYPYEGMKVYCAEDKKLYVLIGNDPTTSVNWQEVGSSGGTGGIIDVETLPTSNIKNTFYRLDNLLEYNIDYTETISWAEADEYLQSFSDFLTEHGINHTASYRGDTSYVPTAHITNPEIFLRTENSAVKDKPLKDISFYADTELEYTLCVTTFDGSIIYLKDKEIFTIYKGSNNTLYAGSEKNQTIDRIATYADMPDVSKKPNTFIGTQAEWDALTTDEKLTYQQVNITDDDGGANLDYYSTTEVKTNKVWIDGKPIYRRIFVFTGEIAIREATFDISDWNIDTPVAVITQSAKYQSQSNPREVIPRFGTNGELCGFSFNPTTLLFRAAGFSYSWYDCIVTLEYTKTTD